MDAKGTSTTTAGAGDAKGDAQSTASTTTAAADTKVAATETKAAASQSMLEGDKGETKQAGDETKSAATETKDAKGETKAAELVDEKWEPPALEGGTRDAKVVGDVKALLVKHKVSAALAKELFEYADKQGAEGAKAAAVAAEEQKATRRAADFKAIEADKEMGGAKLEETKADYHRAIRALGGKELADALRAEGLENMPALVRAFAKAGRSLAEDTVDGTNKDAGKTKGDPFERHVRAAYPRMFNKES